MPKTKRTFLPSELPKVKNEKESLQNILNMASQKGGFRIKNPYFKDYFDLECVIMAVGSWNKIMDKHPDYHPSWKKVRIHKILRNLVKEFKLKNKEFAKQW